MLERRSFTRCHANLSCKIQIKGNITSFDGEVRDISRLGARIFFKSKLSLKPNHEGTIIKDNNKFSFTIVRPMSESDLSIGVLFEKHISEENFRIFIDKFSVDVKGDSIIIFKSYNTITNKPFIEGLKLFIHLFLVIDAAYQIYVEIHSRVYNSDFILYPPNIQYIKSSSPIIIGLNVFQMVTAIIKFFIDLIDRYEERRESDIKKIEKNKNSDKHVLKNNDIAINNSNYDIVIKEIELNKAITEELKEVLNLVSASHKLFGYSSKEMNILKETMFPNLKKLLEEGHLKIKNDK